ncbi:MAG TPA: hypothetical protein VFJ63_02375 [Candidatus Bathyarchaeia archaeon]|nr:hypothetical protein [Candidatus Bathyarchaeia archaeon]
MARGQSRSRLNILQYADPYALFGAVVCFVLLLAEDPWWTVDGLSSGNLLSFQVSPYYLRTAATGISSTASFSGPLGFATRILLILGFVSLAAASVRPNAWWRDIMVYFGLSALVELFLSFLLMLHAAEVMFLGAYGSSPPFIGTGQLSGSIVGLDLASHVQPLVTAGFSLPLYLGLASCTLVGFSVLSRARRGNRRSKGVGAIFSYGQEDPQE